MLTNLLDGTHKHINFQGAICLNILQHGSFKYAKLACDGVTLLWLLMNHATYVISNGLGFKHDSRAKPTYKRIVKDAVASCTC